MCIRSKSVVLLLLLVIAAFIFTDGRPTPRIHAQTTEDVPIHRMVDRSPVDLALSDDGQWLVTANETSNTISLIDVAQAKVIDEIQCGNHPSAVMLCRDGNHVLVCCSYSGEIMIVQISKGHFIHRATIYVGFEPVGATVTPDGQHAYVALSTGSEVVKVDLDAARVTDHIPVSSWPRYLALSPDGSKLAVGCSGANQICVIDTKRGEVQFKITLTGAINFGHMQCSADGKYVYFPWMIYRTNPINVGNIRLGWVLASRVARIQLDQYAYREAISLDVPRKAVSDPHGLVISDDQRRLVVAASGSHELLVYRLGDLPFIGVGGPGDLIDRKLLSDDDLFYRIPLGGRPMDMEMAKDSRTLFVANYLNNSIQVVDIESRNVSQEIPLGTSAQKTLARRGMEIFYDGQRSLDQWYSCHSCHYNGGVNSRAMDTMNDGSRYTIKTVLPLYNLPHTGPWTWHGWQKDLHDAMHKSFTGTMQGTPVTEDDSKAILAYFASLRSAPNPYRNPDGSFSSAALRGKAIFESERAGCNNCHSGKYFTDGKIHDVGTGELEDRYDGFNTPTLIGVHRKVRLLHDGRLKSLEAVLTTDHAPDQVTGNGNLEAAELADLIEYVKSL
ncbi:MAG: hypothetical protein VX738_08710 [Planctomycetota bacterium]|nr:hypothetical protein [Planctomycetota bacterium]